MVKLYDRKNSLVACDILNDRAVPWYKVKGMKLLSVLTDRGAEHCRNVEAHEYQLYLALEDIDHSRTMNEQMSGVAYTKCKMDLSD